MRSRFFVLPAVAFLIFAVSSVRGQEPEGGSGEVQVSPPAITFDEALAAIERGIAFDDLLNEFVFVPNPPTEARVARVRASKAPPAMLASLLLRCAAQYVDQGETESCVDWADEAVRIFPNAAARRRFLLATVAVESQGDLRTAIAECEAGIAEDDEFVPNHHLLAALLLQHGEFRRLVKVCREDPRRAAERPIARCYAIALSCAPFDDLRDGGRALEIADALLSEETPEPVDRHVRALALAELGRYEEAAAEQEAYIAELDEDRRPPHLQIAEQFRKGRPHRREARSEATESAHAVRRRKLLTDLLAAVRDEMVRVEGGAFSLGTPEKGEGEDDERPAAEREVAAFYLGKHEVSLDLYWRVLSDGFDDYALLSTGKERQPVEGVSWNDANRFVARLNELVKAEVFRLPTEAEWEFAAERGNEEEDGELSDRAWFADNAGKQAHEVGTKKANALGIFDMEGNVAEWCSDRYARYSAEVEEEAGLGESLRVHRGGSWASSSDGCRIAARGAAASDDRRSGLGLRLAADAKALERLLPQDVDPDELVATILDPAVEEAEKAWRAHPGDVDMRIAYVATVYRHAVALHAKEDYRGALKAFRSVADGGVTRLDEPFGEEFELSIAWILATCPDASLRDGEAALPHARAACGARHWSESFSLQTLAAVWAERGEFGEAATRQRKAIDNLPAHVPDREKVLANMQETLKQFESDKALATKAFWE